MKQTFYPQKFYLCAFLCVELRIPLFWKYQDTADSDKDESHYGPLKCESSE